MSGVLLPSTGEGRLSRKSQKIVSRTLIRRSSGEVTDIRMKLARLGMTLVEIPLLVSSLVLS